MSLTRDSTLHDPKAIITDLQRQLAAVQRTLDQRTAERDEAQRRLAERTVEGNEALARQAATTEVLQVINSSSGNLAPVFDAILEKAHSLCDADFGALMSYDGNLFHPITAHGASARFLEVAREGIRPGVNDPFAQLLRGEQLSHVADLVEIAALPSTDRLPLLDVAIAAGIRTQPIVPLRKANELLGAITANRREVRPFTSDQIALLQNFAAQAVIAMENARLLTETREALEQQTATAEVLGVINSSPSDLAPVFDTILEKAHSLCGVAAGSLQINEGGKFRAVAMRGVPDPVAEQLRRPFEPKSGAPAFRLLAGEPFVHIADMLESPRQRPDNPRAGINARHGIRTVLFVPLRKDSDVLGYISAYRFEVRAFTDKQIALLQNFAAQAVIAMDNARLLTETREALEQQTATAEVLQVIK
jgi:GAF domain-containing protein